MTKNSFVPPDPKIKVLNWPKLGKLKPEGGTHAQRKASRIAAKTNPQPAKDVYNGGRNMEVDRHEDDTDNWW